MSVSFSEHKDHATLSIGKTMIVLDKESHFISSSTDFLVNPAQPKLTGGGGLDKVIHEAAGPALKEACKHIPKVGGIRCPTGRAKLTHAANLRQAYVIHTVGPKISKNKKVSKEDKQKLWDCYHNCLMMAEQYCKYVKNPGKAHPSWMDQVHSSKKHSLKQKLSSKPVSITFPCISTGSYDYPADKAAKVAIRSMADFVHKHSHYVREIHISCAKNQKDIPHLLAAMKKIK